MTELFVLLYATFEFLAFFDEATIGTTRHVDIKIRKLEHEIIVRQKSFDKTTFFCLGSPQGYYCELQLFFQSHDEYFWSLAGKN